ACAPEDVILQWESKVTTLTDYSAVTFSGDGGRPILTWEGDWVTLGDGIARVNLMTGAVEVRGAVDEAARAFWEAVREAHRLAGRS
ncbi:MAG: hypothetical protein Q8S13_10745, partial [Dehalococcoidia bacterium]|nr:hypothetical protein [Dehalococcoidia bacterium]